MTFTKGHKLNIGNKYAKGMKHTDEWKKEASNRMLGNQNGFVVGKESPRKGKKSTTTVWNKGKKLPQFSGVNHPRYIKDRTQIKLQDRKNNPRYKEWRRIVWTRDSYKCRIGNEECCGRIEAHHIIPWSESEELRYEVNNGITLCHFHHPIKKSESKEMESSFRRMIDYNLPYLV